ncbi:MAG: hypothetical protein IPL84_07595 [Chitinophagaceae bacterium]|nr:hypothetical protein [Chitinophagaceae bacterium]
MKHKIKISNRLLVFSVCLFSFLMLFGLIAHAQDEKTPAVEKKAKAKPVKNTFQSVWIIDNQTVLVPVKKTLEMDIMHRFGSIQKGYKDFWGLFASSNIRLGVSYVPINKLQLGIGITKRNMIWDGSAKYSIITQTPHKYPVSVSFYTNMAYDTRKDEDGTIFKYESQRFSFFHQLLIARKITDKLSVQVAPSLSHQNGVNGYFTKNDSTGTEIYKEMKFDHFAIALSARYKLTNVISVMVNYDQPLTKHASNNPNPNLSFGLEMNTSSHSFQIFAGNFYNLVPQQNNLYNNYNPFTYTDKVTNTEVRGGNFVIGFNITRLWNY